MRRTVGPGLDGGLDAAHGSSLMVTTKQIRVDGSQAGSRRTKRGFTLIELVVVVAVIAILAALLVPVIIGQIERSRVAGEAESLNTIAKAMVRFRTDTGHWPYGDGYFNPGGAGYLDPIEFAFNDTALYALPNTSPPLQACDTFNIGEVCWAGPYINHVRGGRNLGDQIDPWGNKRLVAFYPREHGNAVVVISRGPDGIDQTGCTDGGCTRNVANILQGLPSVPGADDIVVVVGGFD